MTKMAKYKIKLLDKFENKQEDWNFGDLERDLIESRKNTSYHDAKSIIIEAHKSGKYKNTVKQYIYAQIIKLLEM